MVLVLVLSIRPAIMLVSFNVKYHVSDHLTYAEVAISVRRNEVSASLKWTATSVETYIYGFT